MLAYATLLHLQTRFPDVLAIVADWLSTRTNQPWTAQHVLDATVWRYPLIEVRTALARPPDGALWALQVDTRDARVPGRDWRLELALRESEPGGVRATIVVHASDLRGVSRDAPPVPYSQPTLVRALLERGAPVAGTPGLEPFPLDSEADAFAVAARITAPHREHVVVAVCRGESPLDVDALRTTVTGIADVIELRPVMPHEITAALKSVQAWPPPGRAAVFPPRTSLAPQSDLDRRPMFAADARTLGAAILRMGAPRVLAAHVSLDRMREGGVRPSTEDDVTA